ncbi:hypothetical protein Sste5346_007059 [Sporothrix stenoceras]|uniref:F-box domain-containing protein n=1 Tax=Sporothrix stenoceras TaxID=5173 RepID=A0ABR3YVG2_9PEZI
MAGVKRNRDEDRDDRGQQNERPGGDANSTAAGPGKERDADGPPTKRSKSDTTSQAQGACAAGSPTSPTSSISPSGTDRLSPLSDELLIRILGNLPMADLLSLAPVSRRFHRLADDSQLWKAIYYERYVLPRAMRIPGFRGGSLMSSMKTTTGGEYDMTTRASSYAVSSSERGHERSTEVDSAKPQPSTQGGRPTSQAKTDPRQLTHFKRNVPASWKQQFKLRHNWARGKCAVEELRLSHNSIKYDGSSTSGFSGQSEDDGGDYDGGLNRILVKVVDGIAVTADQRRGLRVWELKSRNMAATGDFSRRGVAGAVREEPSEPVRGNSQSECNTGCASEEATSDDNDDTLSLTPRSLAIDASATVLDIAVGLLDGGFDIWQYDLIQKVLLRRFSHAASSSGPLSGIAYSHPYVLTATDSGLISLYAFGPERKRKVAQQLSAPHLLTSLRSHTSRPPLALSIRKLASLTIASIAYTFSTRQGWSIGIQDLHVEAGEPKDNDDGSGGFNLPTVVATRLANTLPISANDQRPSSVRSTSSQRAGISSSPSRSRTAHDFMVGAAATGDSRSSSSRDRVAHQQGYEDAVDGGPTTLCYTHPYLLATMPDNTLILHLCTSNASTLAISAGIRLWGHTSGISDAEITARGKAVSVSMRGDEMRVWELEGRPAAERGRSVAIRPNASDAESSRSSSDDDSKGLSAYDWDERRNWVGFDDEMVIVLKESRGGRESLLMYDFT